jgi:hypothetical protein
MTNTENRVENAIELVDNAMDTLKEVSRTADQFIDYATICNCLRDIAKGKLVIDKESDYQYDATTLTNLEVLSEILDASAMLFKSCDEYYH